MARNTKLPSRPHLDHLRKDAKSLLADLKQGDPTAIRAFQDHLPDAKRMTAAAIRAAGFRLADAQSVVARSTGFASWPSLSRHVGELRGLEGEWRFASLEVDGAPVPAAATTDSRLLIDGDRFRMESPEATYEGIFTIDVEATPPRIDIDFVDGPEAGNRCEGIYELSGDGLVLCLGLSGAARPTAFTTTAGSGHALERLRRTSAARPANVTGGAPPANAPVASAASASDRADPASFDVPMTDLLRRLEGEWRPLELVKDGKPMPAQWLAMGTRTARGNVVKVVFGGKTMVHAKVRIDEGCRPLAVDYLALDGDQAGTLSLGIMDWDGDDARFLMATAGRPRPASFAEAGKGTTLSRWRRR